MPQLPFVQFTTPSIGRKRPGFLERIGETAAQTGVAVAGQILASRVTARDMSQAQFQNELDTGRILRRTTERNELAVNQGVNPDEIGFEGPDGGQYFRSSDLQPIRAEQQLDQEQAERVTFQGSDIGSRAEVDVASAAGLLPSIIPASLTEASLAREEMLAQRRQALDRDPNADVSSIDNALAIMERDPNLTVAEVSQATGIGVRIAQTEVNYWQTMQQLARTDQELAIRKVANGLAFMQTWELLQEDGTSRTPLTLPMAIDIQEQNEEGLRWLEDHRMVQRVGPLSYMDRITDLQTKSELIPSLSNMARVLIQAGEGADFDGDDLDPAQLAQRLHSPDMIQRLGGYLLWADNQHCPQCIMSQAEKGVLPQEVQSGNWGEAVRVAESLFILANPQLPRGFLTERLSGFLTAGGEGPTGVAFDAIAAELAQPRPSDATPFFDDVRRHGITRGTARLFGAVGMASEIAVEAMKQEFRAGAVRGENTEEDASLVGEGVDLRGIGQSDQSIVEGVARTIQTNPGAADSLRLDWNDRIFNPERYREFMISEVEANGALDADTKAAQIAVIRAATEPELIEDAARQRGSTLEGIEQGAK